MKVDQTNETATNGTLGLVLCACLWLGATGCNTTEASFSSTRLIPGTTNVVTTVEKIKNRRSAWSTESYLWEANTNGTWRATANKSGPDAATVGAVRDIVNALAGKIP